MIEIDGNQGEGGGQIVRTALALSTLTGQPFRVANIRKNRPQSGLKAQHLTAVEALKSICGATTNPLSLGSTNLEYSPGKMKGGAYSFDIGTAGSITLLLQALLPPLLFAPKKVTLTLTGGTAGKWQAPVEYFQHVLLPQVQRFCTSITCTMNRRGYYPRGGGQVTLEVKPLLSLNHFDSFDLFLAELRKKVRSFELYEPGELVQIKGTSHASRQLMQRRVAERQADAARLALQKYHVPVEIQSEYHDASSIGSGIALWAQFTRHDEPYVFLGADALGEERKNAADVGSEAAGALMSEIDSGALVDVHLADQLLPFMALAAPSKIKTSSVSEHARTNMDIIEKFLPVTFEIVGNVICVHDTRGLSK